MGALQFIRPYKRAFSALEVEPEWEYPRKRRQEQCFGPPSSSAKIPFNRPSKSVSAEPNRSTTLSKHSAIQAWISTVSDTEDHLDYPESNRASSCPPSIDPRKTQRLPLSTAAIKQMAQTQSQRTDSVAQGSQSGKPTTSSPLYRETIFYNNISMDLSGRRMPQTLKDFIKTDILKERSPPLNDAAVDEVIDTALEIAESTEGPTNTIIRSHMFPLKHAGVAEGGNTLWNTIALPRNPDYEHELSAPKPDAYLGYSQGQETNWPLHQANVINHPKARPYTKPGRGNSFPFLMVELKAEAAKGTLYVAENQAAGSGSHSVNSVLWLLEEAKRQGLATDDMLKDTLSYSAIISHRLVIFYIHWYSEEQKRFYMSYVKSYSTVEAADIRACNSTVKNIVDHALGTRKTRISAALQQLSPIPAQWNPPKMSSTTRSTSVSSVFGDDRSSKKGRKRRKSKA